MDSPPPGPCFPLVTRRRSLPSTVSIPVAESLRLPSEGEEMWVRICRVVLLPLGIKMHAQLVIVIMLNSKDANISIRWFAILLQGSTYMDKATGTCFFNVNTIDERF